METDIRTATDIEVRRVRVSEDNSRDLFCDGVQGLKRGAVLPDLLQRHTDQAHVDFGCVISKDDVGHIEDEGFELRVVLFLHGLPFFAVAGRSRR